MFLGDFTEDHATVTCMFTTHASTGAPVAPNSAFEAADVIIYKNGSATQKATTNGVTMTSPFDSITGLHCVVIDTSNDTGDGGFWVAGAVYTLVLSPDETVDSVAVAKVIGQFGIELSGALRPATASRKLVVDAAGLADANMVKAGPSGSGTAQTAGDIIGDTNDIQSRLPAALVSGRMDSSVGAMASAVLTATAIAADAITDAKVASDVTIASVTGAVGSVTGAVGSVTGNVGGNVTGSVGSVTGLTASDVAAIKAKTDNLPSDPADASVVAGLIAAVETKVDDIPTNAELATALGTADDAVLSAISGLNNLSAAQVNTEVDTALADVGLTTTITGRIDAAISTRLASGSYTAPANSTIAAIDAKTSNLPSDPADQSLVIAATDALATLITTVDTVVDGIKAKTDSLTFTVSGQVDANVQSVNETAITGAGTTLDPWGP